MNAIIDMPVLFQDQDIAFTFEAPALKDAGLLVHGFTAQEKLFELSEVVIELVSDDPKIDINALLDTPATLTIHHKYAGIRHFSGIIADMARRDEGLHRTFYTVVLMPALGRLAHGSDSRIFQQKSVPEIIAEVLKESRVEDMRFVLEGTHVAREYCVQYNETHLDFVRRIAAEEGIWFFFTSGENGQNQVTFIDTPMIVPKLKEMPELEYNANPGGVAKGVFCRSFTFRERLRATSFTQRERLFTNPGYSQEHRADRQADNGTKGDYDLYNYPGGYKYDNAGKPFTKTQIEAVRVEATTGEGRTNAPALTPGRKVRLTEHPNEDCNVFWHLLTVTHVGEQPQALKEEAGAGATTYANRFLAMPADLNYAPPKQPKPKADGPEIATVSGPEGEEIYCDDWGRVKLSYPWDRRSKDNEHSSVWTRVTSSSAGGTFGEVILPRVKQEVLVSYMGGDPDQPIITGRSYNALNLPPYKLPEHKTRTVWRSQTHKGKGYNELRFEDENDRQEVYVYAQKDRNEKTNNHHSERINNNWVQSVGHNKGIEVGNNLTEIIDGNMELRVGPGNTGTLTPSSASRETQGIGTTAEALGRPETSEKGNGNLSIAVEQNKNQSIGANHDEDVRVNKNTTVGRDYNVTVKRTIEINAGDRIILNCGQSRIVMTEDGTVTISAKNIITTGDENIKMFSDVVKVN
nr:type VI secretion system tip protein TssI/VgrG [Marinicella sp. W31]MDC2877304.1 type VI secretion system tip protein TssI/VgrG [Marinicella sp. W31]